MNELQTKLPSVQDNLREAKAEYAQVKSAEEQETQTVFGITDMKSEFPSGALLFLPFLSKSLTPGPLLLGSCTENQG